ncbi:hypothetical protein, partial [Candidatus Similichlamydia laticola]|uniref:hypothetical protein n=1 Tax=Candidatus Similichlamydia laticola TaxID=2170265 RepID=UPI0011C049E8
MSRPLRTFFPTSLSHFLAESLELSEGDLLSGLRDFYSSCPFFSKLFFRSLSELLEQEDSPEAGHTPSFDGTLSWEWGSSSPRVSSCLSEIEVFSLEEARSVFDVLLETEPLHPFWKAVYGTQIPSDGLFVYIPPGESVVIDFSPFFLKKKWLEQATFYFVLGKGASLRLSERVTASPGKHWVQIYLHLLGQKGSSLILEREWSRLACPVSLFTSIHLEKEASCTCLSRGAASPWTWADYSVLLSGEEARVCLGAAHSLTARQRFAITTAVRHVAPRT